MDEQENLKDENIHLRRFLRVLANILILCSLGGSGYLIYFVVKRSQDFAKLDRKDLSWYQKNEVTFVFITFLNVQSPLPTFIHLFFQRSTVLDLMPSSSSI